METPVNETEPVGRSVRWAKWVALAVPALMLLIAVMDLLVFPLRDDSGFTGYTVSGEPTTSTPEWRNEYLLTANLIVAVLAAAVLLPVYRVLPRARIGMGVVFGVSGLLLPLYLMPNLFTNPLQALRFRTDAGEIEQDGPLWYLPARIGLLALLAIGTVALIGLAIALMRRRTR